jgi:hypothetical protein
MESTQHRALRTVEVERLSSLQRVIRCIRRYNSMLQLPAVLQISPLSEVNIHCDSISLLASTLHRLARNHSDAFEGSDQ